MKEVITKTMTSDAATKDRNQITVSERDQMIATRKK
jgi:hypothetical protein